MNDAERARELERLMRAYGSQLVRLCYVCLRDADLAHDAAQEAFLGEYGPFDEREAEIDAVVSVLNGLISAYGRERLPAWSAGLIEELRGGLYERVERLIGK